MECEEFFSSLRTGHPPTIQPRPCRPKAGIGIVMMMVIMMVTMMVMMTMMMMTMMMMMMMMVAYNLPGCDN